jgi:hypothetical protein
MQQHSKWHIVYKTLQFAEAIIIEGLLLENAIPVQVLNKQDSSYNNFGEIEIYVPFIHNEVAKNIISKSLLN